MSEQRDYSSYVTLINNTNYTFNLTGSTIVMGYWATSPPKNLPPGSTQTWQLSDIPVQRDSKITLGTHRDSKINLGSEGFCSYMCSSPNVSLSFHFACLVFAMNQFYTSSSNKAIVGIRTTNDDLNNKPLRVTVTLTSNALANDGLVSLVSPELAQELKELKDAADAEGPDLWAKVDKELTELKNKEQLKK